MYFVRMRYIMTSENETRLFWNSKDKQEKTVKKYHWTRRIAAGAAAFAAALGMVCPAFAEIDVDYEGPLDSVTGEGVIDDSEDGGEQSSRVQITTDVYYDKDDRKYIYTFDNFEIACSAADGMIVQNAVSIAADEGVALTVYESGEEYTDEALSSIREPGQYVLQAMLNGQSQRVLAFTIVDDASGKIDGYSMPAGFVISGATRDGAETGWDRSYVDMTEEGRYIVQYSCARAGVSYELDVIVDHTPPELTIEGVDEDNCARGPVRLLDVEDGCSVSIQHNGEWTGYQEKLTESGEYRVRVRDEAGNTTDYYFTILIYFDGNSFVFMGLVLAVITATVLYMVLSRKRLRVR